MNASFLHFLPSAMVRLSAFHFSPFTRFRSGLYIVKSLFFKINYAFQKTQQSRNIVRILTKIEKFQGKQK